MANNRPPILGYLQSAVADNTAHSSIDRLLLEEMNRDPLSGLAQQPQHTMRRGYHWYETDPEGYNPTEGLPVAGTAKLIKHGASKGKKILDFIASNLKNKSKRLSMEAKEHSKQIKNIGEDIKETQSWWTNNKGKPSFKTAEEVRNQMKLVEQFPVQFMKKGVKGVQYPKQTQEYKVYMDRMRNTANNLEMKEKMKSFADYKFQESSLLKNRNDFLIKAINDYKKTGMVRPSVEKAIREYSGGLERLPKSTPPSVEDVLKSIR